MDDNKQHYNSNSNSNSSNNNNKEVWNKKESKIGYHQRQQQQHAKVSSNSNNIQQQKQSTSKRQANTTTSNVNNLESGKEIDNNDISPKEKQNQNQNQNQKQQQQHQHLQATDPRIQSIANLLNQHNIAKVKLNKQPVTLSATSNGLTKKESPTEKKQLTTKQQLSTFSELDNVPPATSIGSGVNSKRLLAANVVAAASTAIQVSSSSSNNHHHLTSTTSTSNRQVDQGNSYFYAYNEFVTSPLSSSSSSNNNNILSTTTDNRQQMNSDETSRQNQQHSRKQQSKIEESNIQFQIQTQPSKQLRTQPNSSHLKQQPEVFQASLIETDSEEEEEEEENDDDDDEHALSYILQQQRQLSSNCPSHPPAPSNSNKQHRAYQAYLEQQENHLHQNKHYHLHHNLNKLVPSESPFEEETLDQLEDETHLHHHNNNHHHHQRIIEHHLSCSRSSHPSHICGIAGGRNERHLSNIAARLKQESQRAFVLNQRHRNPCVDSRFLAASSGSSLGENNPANVHQQAFLVSEEIVQQTTINNNDNSSPPESSCSSEQNISSISAIGNQIQQQQQRLLSSSIADADNKRRKRRHKVNQSKKVTPEEPGYLSWLFCCLCNALGSSKSGSASRRPAISKADNNLAILSLGNNMYTSGGNNHSSGGEFFGGAGSGNDNHYHQHHYSTTNNNLVNSHHHHHQQQQQQQQQHFNQLVRNQQASTSDSSLNSSANNLNGSRAMFGVNHSRSRSRSKSFSNSLMQFLKSCCSKKCLFISCIMLILFIFIIIICLSVYLNFLINLNKNNLIPLSGRLKVDSQGDSFNELLLNKTSSIFLLKQLQYETILRGAMDRTQLNLKSFPQHLVKLEVYQFKPGSLWIYFRLFINKRTLMLDNQLMKRKSPDELIDKQFLPRLTQQTLLSGFEQLTSNFIVDIPSNNSPSSSSSSALESGTQQTTGSRPQRNLRSSQNLLNLQNKQNNKLQQNDQVKSFDEQISRLMPIIESIDLQSIQVRPEFDMLSSPELTNQTPPSMSDNLKASSQFLTPTTTTTRASIQANKSPEYDTIATGGGSTSTEAPGGTTDEISVNTRKIIFYDIKENTTRPGSNNIGQQFATPTQQQQQQQDSAFLTNQQQKKPKPISAGQTVKEILAEVGRENRVVKLFSGQPVVSQNPSINSQQTVNRMQLFNQLPTSTNSQQQQLQPQMQPPYQRPGLQTIPLSSSTTTSTTSLPPTQKSIQDLWSSALSKKNVTIIKSDPNQQASQQIQQPQSNPKRVVASSASNNLSQNNGPAKIQLSWDVSEAIRTQMLSQQQQPASSSSTSNPLSPTTTTTTTTTPTSVQNQNPNSSSVKPKVSPPLKHAGAIISTTNQRQSTSQAQAVDDTSATTSAIVLNREVQAAANAANQGQQQQHLHHIQNQLPVSITQNHQNSAMLQSNQTRSSSVSPSSDLQNNNKQISTSSSSTSSLSNPTRSRQPPTQQLNRTLANQRQRANSTSKPATTIKKFKKDGGLEANNTSANITSKGIKIVDNFLASIDASKKLAAEELKSQNNKTSQLPQLQALQPPQKVKFNYNSDSIAPPLATTIELIRSTTSMAPLPASSSASSPVAASIEVLLTTPRPARIFNKPENIETVTLQPLNKPGTSSFSNQWRPIANVFGEPSDKITTRKPNLSLILGVERLPAQLTSPGSQSPFAMSPAILESGPLKPIAPLPRLKSNRLSNTYQVLSSSSTTSGGNGFESHRVSRMRQNAGSLSTTEDSSTNNFVSGSTSSSSSSSSTTTSSSISSDVSAITPISTRLVDDFVITADKVEGNTRGSTFLAPLVISGMHEIDPIAQIRASNPVTILPKRTRGPFAFDSLASKSNDLTDPTALFAPLSSGSEGQSSDLAAGISERASASQQVEADSKLLMRKKLFLDSNVAESLTESSSNRPEVAATTADVSDFGERRRSRMVPAAGRFEDPMASILDNTNLVFSEQQNNQTSSNRCTHYGCKAKGSLRFVCLNEAQICDDFIDCQDESDELDCVSLLQHDKTSTINGNKHKLSFSNGAGIIYLNRKGSLAPMCIDYFIGQQQAQTNSAHDLEATNMMMKQANLMKKQQELIRQINTIGQYACSLQSFSRLVSVKINHYNLIDSMNVIKNSKIFHRLSIVSPLESGLDRGTTDPSYGSYRSGASAYEVEISTSSECPSQRTVFVKCGSFECGQDGFSVIEQQSHNNNNSSKPIKKSAVVINDFPWLVKLYWHSQLACHGYLIDDLWLISSSDCFSRDLARDSAIGWSAEISYEHYGNNDYQSIDSNRRNIQQVLNSPQSNPGGSSIVLAKLEKPVRFSPLNRPICLPTTTNNLNNHNRTIDSSPRDFRNLKSCVTVRLPMRSVPPPTQDQLQRDLLLKKVKVNNFASDCFKGFNNFKEDFSSTSSVAATTLDNVADTLTTTNNDLLNRDSICVSPLNSGQGDDHGGRVEDEGSEDYKQDNNNNNNNNNEDKTHVLICSTIQGSRFRPSWTVVGVQNKAFEAKLKPQRQLFTSVSSQIDWIIDTMNPKQTMPTDNLMSSDPFGFGRDERMFGGGVREQAANSNSNIPMALSSNSQFNANTTSSSSENLMLPPNSNNPTFDGNPNGGANQICNRFRCSSGECLSFSRICDGLYDCSSQDDEKDCHK